MSDNFLDDFAKWSAHHFEIVEKNERDAKRYRWLRRQYAEGLQTYFAEDCAHTEDGIDAEIDALMAKSEE